MTLGTSSALSLGYFLGGNRGSLIGDFLESCPRIALAFVAPTLCGEDKSEARKGLLPTIGLKLGLKRGFSKPGLLMFRKQVEETSICWSHQRGPQALIQFIGLDLGWG